MMSIEDLNLSCLTTPDSNAFFRRATKKSVRTSEKLVASVTNGLRDTAVEQIDIRRLTLPNHANEQ